MLRIALITETTQLGGAEINLLTIATALQSRGERPCAIVSGDGPLTQRLDAAAIPLHRLGHTPFLSSSLLVRGKYKLPNPLALLFNMMVGIVWSLRLSRYLRKRHIDVVHTMSMWAHAFAGLAGRLAGCSVVWHFQDIVSPRSGWGLYRWLVHYWARHIPHRILCVSTQVAAQFHDNRVALTKVRILENTVDVARFEHARQQSSRNVQTLTIGTVARLTPWKGHEVALQTARILKKQGVSLRWLFAGDDTLGVQTYRTHLQDLVERWRLDDVVCFEGWIEDIAQFYAQLDVLVHVPIEPEPFGLVLAEAMAAGLPVITTTGGGAEAIVAKAGGVLVPPGQPDPVAEALLTFVRYPQELRSRGQMARQYAVKHFDLQEYISRLLGIYRELQPHQE